MIKYNVIIELPAENDLMEVFNYITDILKEPAVAKRLFLGIKEQILKLDELPFRHAVISEEPYSSAGIRKIPIENYLIFYSVDDTEKEVHILRILYDRREWQNLI